MGNKFINAVETSEQECCFDLLELPFTQSSVRVEFISTCPPDERVFIAKDENTLRNMKSTSTDIKLPGIIDKYSKRPSQLYNWCLADYVSQLDTRKCNENEKDDIYYNNEDWYSDEDITNKQEDTTCRLFPIYLKGGRVLYKREKKKVIRFVNYRKNLDPENFYREKLLLYTPWQCEEKDLFHGKNTYYEAYELKKDLIFAKMMDYEPLSRILHEAEQEYQKNDDDHFDDLVPSTQNENRLHESIPVVNSNQYDYFDPDREESQCKTDIAPYLFLSTGAYENSIEMVNNVLSDEEYRKHIRSLNQQQYEFFTHIINIAQTREHQELCCLHGGAGTGKSHVLKALFQALYRILCTQTGQNKEDCRILIMAPTGKAAYNAKGTTVHAAFHIPANHSLHEYSPLSYDVLNTYRANYQNLEWILLDEISMVSNDMLKYIHLRLQDIKKNKVPFGGVNIVAIGDLCQLQPVTGHFVFSDLKHGYGPLAVNLWCK